MKKRSLEPIVALLGISLIAAACGGGGGGGGLPTPTSPGNRQVNETAAHDALTKQFINEATVEGLDFTLVKQDTLQKGFILVKTPAGQMEAYDVDNWKPGSQVTEFQPAFSSYYQGFFSTTTMIDAQGDSRSNGLDSNGNLIYGYYPNNAAVAEVYFSVAQPSSKDLQKMAAFQQAFTVQASAKKIQKKYGVTLSRAVEVAKLAIQVKNKPKMEKDDYEILSQQLLGVPVSKLDSAMSKATSGDALASADVDDIINTAAETNGVGPEQARSILNTIKSIGQ